jgi:hypothetical protein
MRPLRNGYILSGKKLNTYNHNRLSKESARL